MATGLPVLERAPAQQEDRLKAYGKLSGGAEPAVMTEEQKALDFNSRIRNNYKKLIDPDFKSAEDIMGDAPVQEAAQPVYDSPEAYARATLYPEREQEQAQAQQFVHHRVEGDLFRADSPINNRTAYAQPQAPAYEQPAYEQAAYEQPAPAYEEYAQPYAEEASEDLTPTATTIQYRTDLYRDEQQVQAAAEEKKRFAMTATGKLLMCVYAIVVVVVLALIIINTSVLNTLDRSIAERQAQLDSIVAQAQALKEEVEELTSEESILARAEEMGIIKN